jgi:hypothetical protein
VCATEKHGAAAIARAAAVLKDVVAGLRGGNPA